MSLRNTTKMGCQAALAIFIAELICWYFQLERGYWTVLTAMALTTQTWGESIKRSFERVIMTILGGIFGTVLYFILPHNEALILCLLLFCVFFTVYLFQIYHLIAVFMMTGFVVFLFALIGDWNLILLRERILDTALGALIAIFVGCFFLPVKTNIIDLFVSHLEKIKALLGLVFKATPQTSQVAASQRLYADFQHIRKNALAIRYEVIFHRISRRDFHLLLTQTAFCTQYVVALIEAYRWLEVYLTPEDRNKILVAVDTTQFNLDILVKRLKNEPHVAMLPVVNLTELLTKAISQDPCRFASLESEALGFYNLMYFFTRLNTRLNDIYSLLSGVD